jgi:hypothetical protein
MSQSGDVSADLPLSELSTAGDAEAGDEQPAARWRPPTRWVVLGSVAALVVVLLAVFGTIGWRLLDREKVSLTTPASLAGLTLDTSDEARQTTDYLRTALAAKTSLSSTVGAVYQDAAGTDRKVLLFGGTGTQISPGRDLDQAFALLNDQSGTVTDLREVPAGPLGGVAKCGTSNGDGGAMPVCGWADNGSLAVALFPGRTVDSAARLLLDLRTGIEHRR